MSDDDYLFLSAGNLDHKYRKSIWGGVFFMIAGMMLIVAVFAYYYAHGSYSKDEPSLSQILPIILFFVPSYGYVIWRQGLSERKLYYRAAMRGMLLDAEGISGPIALLEGPVRDSLRNNREPVFRIGWAEVEDFIVEPPRGRKNNQSPPYYKVTLRGHSGGIRDSYFILRDYFKDREQDVLDRVAMYLDPAHIVVNDEIATEGKAEDHEQE